MLLHPSGGLLYHLRALRYRKPLWKPFSTQLEPWLSEAFRGCSELLVVGPSAGYCLSSRFLKQFNKIYFIEPDPIARLLFTGRSLKWPHGATAKSIASTHAILDPSPMRFLKILDSMPRAGVLFSNILGQLSLYLDDFDEASKRPWVLNPGAIETLLENRTWASFHDRLSGPGNVLLEEFVSEAGALSNDVLASFFFTQAPKGLADHDCLLFPKARNVQYWAWELTPGRFHLIEGLKNKANGAL